MITVRPMIKTAGICGGSARISGTRIPVWVLEQSRRLAISESDILQDYPSITHDELHAAWEYARDNAAEIEAEIRDNQEA